MWVINLNSFCRSILTLGRISILLINLLTSPLVTVRKPPLVSVFKCFKCLIFFNKEEPPDRGQTVTVNNLAMMGCFLSSFPVLLEEVVTCIKPFMVLLHIAKYLSAIYYLKHSSLWFNVSF